MYYIFLRKVTKFPEANTLPVLIGLIVRHFPRCYYLFKKKIHLIIILNQDLFKGGPSELSLHNNF